MTYTTSFDLKRQWIVRFIEPLPKTEDVKIELIRFWNSFYDLELYTDDSLGHKGMDDRQGKSKSLQYKEVVFDILHNGRARFPLSEAELRKIQVEIEDHTMLFDEKSLFKTVPNIIRILIRKEGENAKDFLMVRDLKQDDIELLSEFGQYTIEAIIIHVLGTIFNSLESSSIIRVASLVDRLESSVRTQASLLKFRRCNKNKPMATAADTDKKKEKRSKMEKEYPIGTGLVEFMVERGLISLISDLSGTVYARNSQGQYYLPRHLYASCNFDISLLPIKLNFPMVCKPLDWTSACPKDQKPRTLSDLIGGYLSSPSGEIYDRYRLLSSGDLNNFYIDIGEDDNYTTLCSVMNKLQCQAFQINSVWLKFLQSNDSAFVDSGYLMPGFLASMNVKVVSSLLRDLYIKDEVIQKFCSFGELLQTLCKKIQRARYERLIIKLANAYDGYHFYLPAFLDFRGRIYRCGVLHFHERDLARSLITFADSISTDNSINGQRAVYEAAAFHYKAFGDPREGVEWIINNIESFTADPFRFSREAKRPFQFFSSIYRCININTESVHDAINTTPITQDASASAYQIMSYFLLDKTIAKRTNLFPSPDGKIQDIYSFILEELKEFIKDELENNLSTIVINLLTRKLVKNIFMPIIYGKTLMSTAEDLKEHLSHIITSKECYHVASACFKFWRTKYQGMECLIQLFRHIGWFAAARECPVFYRVPYYTTVQDYKKMVPINIWVYDGLHKKRRRVTLRVSSSKRDRRKTEIATFVNFIHQRDANIAMQVVEHMLSKGAPIYTVHDNFITTARYCRNIPGRVIIGNMGPPLAIINDFIYMNVIKPIVKRDHRGPAEEGSYSRGVIPIDRLRYYLEENIPKNISTQMKATWETRILGILKSYDNYTRYVCLGPPSWNAHKEKWNLFHTKLTTGGFPDYCVHY